MTYPVRWTSIVEPESADQCYCRSDYISKDDDLLYPIIAFTVRGTIPGYCDSEFKTATYYFGGKKYTQTENFLVLCDR